METQTILPRRRIAVTALALAALLIFSVGITAFAFNMRMVLIVDGGVETSVHTTRSDAHEILRARGIVLEDDDYLDLSSFHESEDGVIRIHRVKEVTVVDDGVTQQLTGAGSVQRLLDLHGIELDERDATSVPLRQLLEEGMEIVVSRAFDVLVQDYGNEYIILLTEGVVGQALELAGLTLEGEDFVEPDIDAPLEPGMRIEVMRVVYRSRERTTAIDYETERRNNNRQDLGFSRLEQRGVRGEKRVLYSDRYVNGERVESTVVEEEILQEPVAEIRIVGTRVQRLQPGLTPISTLPIPAGLEIVNGRPTHYREVVVGTAKAYTGGGMTASGVPARPGHIAVDPRQFPYGTQLWVVSNDGRYVYGYAIAADTGGFIHRDWSATIDLYMPNEAMCRAWGHRGVTIYVLDLPRVQLPFMSPRLPPVPPPHPRDR